MFKDAIVVCQVAETGGRSLIHSLAFHARQRVQTKTDCLANLPDSLYLPAGRIRRAIIAERRLERLGWEVQESVEPSVRWRPVRLLRGRQP